MIETHQKLRWTMSDGVTLHIRHWPVRDSIAYVCLVHGISEHAGRYQHVAHFLNEHKISVIAADLRGHGLSAGNRGHVASYEQWMDDLAVIESMFLNIATGPTVLYGHSMGGNLVLNFSIRRECKFDRLIATSPMIHAAFQPAWWKFALARTIGTLKPDLKVPTGLDYRQLTSDPQMLQAFREDELILQHISVKSGLTLIESGDWLLKQASQLNHPTLIMHGDADLITSHQKSAEFAFLAGDQCNFQSWPGMLHELHNEIGREKVLAQIVDWLAGSID